MKLRHPNAPADVAGIVPGTIDIRGTRVEVADDGTFELPDEDEAWIRYFAERHGVEPESLVVGGHGDDAEEEEAEEAEEETDSESEADSPTPAELIDDGVCPWCDDYEGDGVPQHAASAHPDEWDDYKEG